ncbi:GlxA family transcriptional regulator [Mesorhizobium sp. M4B.F.Ca.ET.215.01.1.1]|uniref:GlxA family transcriptional regulator n=2 Tax=Mesorhizobium TaxID=68287 RepID=A0ABU5AHB6_9HYPH|nr:MULTISPECIES: GlxA family transcriptional regulator [Mesorhizobium]MDX8536661.1 GlxA family transcriptional regulator [Mesorhizobium abyssinicae]RUW24198.1 GlxA family transcriptional regulator [Mesorhizobium sp. M4B.F.Ca.ET.013.02.1.1]RVD45631.1 GlxA family transcriptional regulator [Mesorhizobium sp. M4B.F.Ca.ET.019.03.1.1]RWX64824.1 helix-turn-helix domain-containing protein [Mesorhizobium sp. M4B.F.Ca.ET.089.01.1.1]TGQ15436.1 GlxA family transcriptional regulator [Mesorhizobium sp. M4B.
MRRIEILAYPDVQLLDVSGPLQVFASANDFKIQAGEPAAYEVMVVAASPRIRTSAGLVLEATLLPPHGSGIDTLIVPGGWGVNAACEDRELLQWVIGRSRDATRTASVCSGAFLLATAGLLDGRRAVTHWGRCAEFARRFPAVRLEPDPIFIRDGNVWTSAGVTAGIDLALSFVEADLGRRMALAVARQLVVFLKRPGGQAQFSQTLKLQEGDERFDRLHGWILDNLDGDLSLPNLADRANMSPRSFSRHYREATGRTPARAIEEIRIEAARRMLERGQAISQTARRCGFGSEETMRRGFLRVLGTNPRDYRERF